jgi:hypothetical protein
VSVDVFPGAKLMQLVEWGYPMGSLRPTPPSANAYSVIHITANIASAENEAAWRIRDTALQNSATFFVNRDGSVVQTLGDPFRMDPWANGDVKAPDTTNPRIARMVRDGVNANERTLVAIENVGNEIAWGSVPGGHPITPAQEETDARIIAYYHPKAGVPISREAVIGHYQLNSVTRTNCPARDKRLIDRIVARARVLAAPQEDDMAWHDDIALIDPELVETRPETSFRNSPDLSSESKPVVLNRVTKRIVIGRVKGFDFGAGPMWEVFISDHGGLKTFHSQDAIKRTKLIADPGGATEAELGAALAQVAALTKRIQVKDSHITQYPKG